MTTSISTNDKIVLIRTTNGISTQTFKTTENLLMAVIGQYFNEQTGNFDGLPLCHLNVRRKIHARLEEIVKSYEDEPEDLCPISGAQNCCGCDDEEIEKCNG